jgi:spore coat polysaccharide biosynthesis predicted glycosyltransferase SpsG
MGGSDPDNVTGVVLRALNGVAVDGMETAVLVGPSNPHGSHLAVAVAESRAHVRLLRNPPNIPEWMAWCDLAITAGGSTLWELAYFHVPAIVILTAENQEPAMMRLDRNGACRCLGYGARLSAGTIAVAVESLCGDPTARAALAAGLAATTDGRGAQRVLAAMRQGDGSSEVEIVREAQRVP